MLDNPYLDTIISLVLVYALLSVLVSMLNEWYVKHIGKRGTFLKAMIERMLNDPNNYQFGHMLYSHPAIARLRDINGSLPSYISAPTFSLALVDLLGDRGYTLVDRDAGVKADLNEPLDVRFRQGVAALKDSPIKRLLMNMADRCVAPTGKTDLAALGRSLGQWFNDHMDRASGEYKDAQRYRLFGLGLLVAVLLNVDSIHLARVFFLNEPLRTSLVQRAENANQKFAQLPDSSKHDITALRKVISSAEARQVKIDTAAAQVRRQQTDSSLNKAVEILLGRELQQGEVTSTDSLVAIMTQWGLPIGYAKNEVPWVWIDSTAQAKVLAITSDEPLLMYYRERNTDHDCTYKVLWVIGILLTGLALSAGAPFWFETMMKLINVRRAGPKPTTKNAS